MTSLVWMCGLVAATRREIPLTPPNISVVMLCGTPVYLWAGMWALRRLWAGDTSGVPGNVVVGMDARRAGSR